MLRASNAAYTPIGHSSRWAFSYVGIDTMANAVGDEYGGTCGISCWPLGISHSGANANKIASETFHRLHRRNCWNSTENVRH